LPHLSRRVVEYVRRYLPGLLPEHYAETTCLFTATPTEDVVLDTADVATGAAQPPARFRIAPQLPAAS
jgi:sarcosine oxidase